MNLIGYIKYGFEIAFLKRGVINLIAKDKNATIPATIFLILGMTTMTVVNAILSNYTLPQIIYDVIMTVLISAILFYGATHILARLFGSKEKFVLFYRAFTLTSIISFFTILALIPKISILIYLILIIWGFIINYVVLKETYKLSKGKAIGLLIILFIAVVIFSLVSYLIAIFIGIEKLPVVV